MPVLSSLPSTMEHCHTLAFLSLSLGSVVLFSAGIYLRRRAQKIAHSQTQSEYKSWDEHYQEQYQDEKTGIVSGTNATSPPPLPSKPPPPYSQSVYENNFHDHGHSTFPIEPQHRGSNHSYYSQSPSPNAFFDSALGDQNPMYISDEPEEYASPNPVSPQPTACSYPGTSSSWASRTDTTASTQSWFDNNPQTYYSTPISTPGSSYSSSIPPTPPSPRQTSERSRPGSYSSIFSTSSLDSDGLPRRRSYTKTLGISNGEAATLNGEILITEGGWRRHTRVFGGGSCKACEESEEKARKLGVVLPSIAVS